MKVRREKHFGQPFPSKKIEKTSEYCFPIKVHNAQCQNFTDVEGVKSNVKLSVNILIGRHNITKY